MATSLNGIAPHKKPRTDPTHPVTVVLGSQWGDEGKGKIVDMIAANADICCRCQVRISVFYLNSLYLLHFHSFVTSYVFVKFCVYFMLMITLIDLPITLQKHVVIISRGTISKSGK